MTPTLKTAYTTAGGGHSYTTSSFTPSSDSLLVAFISLSDVDGGSALSVTGGTLTWTKQTDQADGAGSGLFIYTAPVVTSPGSMTVTVDASPAAGIGAFIIVVEVSGVSPTIVQAVDGNGNGGTPSLALSQAMNTNNLGLFVVLPQSNPANATPPSGWTELSDVGHASPAYGMEVSYINTGSTVSTVTLGSSVTSTWAVAFLELQPGTMGSAPVLNPAFFMFLDW